MSRLDFLHVVGARPNFPKAAPVLSALAVRGATQRLVHTGQHYDDSLSESFFRDLGIRHPDANLNIGSGSHAAQTAALLVALEEEMLAHPPKAVVVYGDVNSTLAATLVASKLQFPIAHVEAGLRSGDRAMPEEVNRIVTDALAASLLTTSNDATENLIREGHGIESIAMVGNTMIDSLLRLRPRFDSSLPSMIENRHAGYLVVTIHRPVNVDSARSASRVVRVLAELAEETHLVFPVHPRGRRNLESAGLASIPNLTLTNPLPYLEFMGLVESSLGVVTDSGGVQEETTVLGVPCFTLRTTTERPVTVSVGTNSLVSLESVVSTVSATLANGLGPYAIPPLWDGNAGLRAANVLQNLVGVPAELSATESNNG